MEAHIEVDKEAFLEGFRAAFEEVRAQAGEACELVADKVVELAKVYAPKRTSRLADSIGRDELVREGTTVSVQVHAGGEGIRETVFMEFGTYKDTPHPYMRPALAAAGGVLRSSSAAAKLSGSNRARLAARRARARAVIRRQRHRGELTAAQARAVSRAVSQTVRDRSRRR